MVTHLDYPKLSGIKVLERTLEIEPVTEVIVVAEPDGRDFAVEAVKRGACDYLQKPVHIEALRKRVYQAFVRLSTRPSEFAGIVGHSAVIMDLLSKVKRVAPFYRSMILTGESGTGKDLLARAVHASSGVRGRFVALNCPAVVDSLFESELFGYVRGAYTGAFQDKAGLFEHAEDGTLFLDEIADMSLSAQAKLLRVLQNQEVLRVGSLAPRKINVRVIAATNRDLRVAIRERKFVGHFAKLYKKCVRGLTYRAQIRLGGHSWPGNIRELENVIGRAVMVTTAGMIDVGDFPPYLQSAPRR